MTMAMLAALVGAWMTGALVLGTLLAATAWLLHRVVRDLIPARVVWGVALFSTLLATFALPVDVQRPRQYAAIGVERGVPSVSEVIRPSEWQRVAAASRAAAQRSAELFADITISASHLVFRAPTVVHVGVLLLWPVASTCLLVTAAMSYRRRVRMMSRGEGLRLHGTDVTMTADIGPAVVGVRVPRIVLPRWLLQRDVDEQRLVIMHERAHIVARDPQLLLAACAAAVCMPWNPAVWYMLSRLRLAIECDCDRRVIAQGAARRRYGELLVNLSAQSQHVTEFSPFPGFSYHPSHLERRLRNMTDRPTTHRISRFAAGALLTAAAFVAACGSELPTSAEVEGMDAASATRRAAALASGSATTEYVVDGKRTDAQTATAISAGRIASVDIRRKDRGTNVITINTLGAVASSTAPGGDTASVSRAIALRANGTGDSTRTLRLSRLERTPSTTTFDGLVIIDGVKADAATMNKLNPERIERVEIVKGSAAELRYGKDGAKGVIEVTTKR